MGKDPLPDAPPLEPTRQRLESTADGCALCVSENFNLEPAEIVNHQCTFQAEGSQRQEVDLASVTGSDIAIPGKKAVRRRQLMLGAVKSL